MVLIASASDHRHRRGAKSSAPANPATPSTTSKVAPEKSSGLHGFNGFSFSWGAHRRLRCSKDGAPVYESASPSPPQHPHTPSPDKENPKPPAKENPAVWPSRPQRPRNLRPLRYAASRPDGARQAAVQSPKLAQAAQPRKRGFDVALTPEEIARDFAAIRGCSTRQVPVARRSKKRPKAVLLSIESMYPGFILKDVDLDNYKIEERVHSAKKRRGE